MNPVIGRCPICDDTLHVARLKCRNCDTSIEGHFSLGRLFQLSSDQLYFIETFIRCEGKINRMEQILGLSYPAVRSRLTEVIEALGYEVGEPEPEVSSEVKSEALNLLSEGKITAEEALSIMSGE